MIDVSKLTFDSTSLRRQLFANSISADLKDSSVSMTAGVPAAGASKGVAIGTSASVI